MAVEKMGIGASNIISGLLSEGKVHGAIGMGGGGGTYIAISSMQSIPMGIPKLCVTTLAAKDLTRQIGVKDITLMPSIVDVAGLNNISRMVIRQAAGAISGMIAANVKEANEPVSPGKMAGSGAPDTCCRAGDENAACFAHVAFLFSCRLCFFDRSADRPARCDPVSCSFWVES